MTWLIKIDFLSVTQQKQLPKIKKSIITYIRNQLSVKQKQPEFNQNFQQSEFKIQWNQVKQTDIDKQLQLLKKQKDETIKYIQIFKFISESFSFFNNDDNVMEQSLIKCNQLIKKYPKSKILYLAKIRMFELLPNKNKQIIKILDQIVSFQKQFQQTDIYYYFKSMSNWQMLDRERKTKQNEYKVFLQLKNKKYYKLTNSTQYINDLKKAISIQSKPIYHVNLALGYMVQNNYRKALEEFSKGLNYFNDSYDSYNLNKIWVQIQKHDYVDFDLISQTIEIRNIQFIVNLYSKKGQLDSHDTTQLQTASKIIQQLKQLKNKQADQLSKKLIRMIAKKQILSEQKIDEAVQKFNHIVNLPNSSSSDYFNYACSLFLNYLKQNDEQILKQSREIINKALEIKSKSKFQKLKFFIQCYMNEFNSANKILENQQEQLINHQAYQQLIDFIRCNID